MKKGVTAVRGDVDTPEGRRVGPQIAVTSRRTEKDPAAGSVTGEARPLVLLDNNVWRRLVDADAVNELKKVSRRGGWQVVACPAVAYEMLATLR